MLNYIEVKVCGLGVTDMEKSAIRNTLAKIRDKDPEAFRVSEKIQSCTYVMCVPWGG